MKRRRGNLSNSKVPNSNYYYIIVFILAKSGKVHVVKLSQFLKNKKTSFIDQEEK
jgi:hypothetical protein